MGGQDRGQALTRSKRQWEYTSLDWRYTLKGGFELYHMLTRTWGVPSGGPVTWNTKWAIAAWVTLGDSVMLPHERKPGSERDTRRFPNDATADLFFHSFPAGEAESWWSVGPSDLSLGRCMQTAFTKSSIPPPKFGQQPGIRPENHQESLACLSQSENGLYYFFGTSPSQPPDTTHRQRGRNMADGGHLLLPLERGWDSAQGAEWETLEPWMIWLDSDAFQF